MDTTKQKYVRLKEFNSFIFFPETIDHSTFKHLNPISAGFCYLSGNGEVVECFGRSVSLNLSSNPDDTKWATRQVYGIEAMCALG